MMYFKCSAVVLKLLWVVFSKPKCSEANVSYSNQPVLGYTAAPVAWTTAYLLARILGNTWCSYKRICLGLRCMLDLSLFLLQKMVTSSGSGSLGSESCVKLCARRHPMDVFSFAKAQPCTTMEAWGMNEIWLQTKYKLQCKLTVLYGAYDQICSAFLYRNKPASQCSTVSPLSFLLYLVTLRCVWPTMFILRFFFCTSGKWSASTFIKWLANAMFNWDLFYIAFKFI